MPTDPYWDLDLVALYDVDNPAGIDHDFYRALADRSDARRIVDLGCGTSLLTRSLSAPGRDVTGTDPSRTMLDWARRQPGAENVTWIEGDATAIAPSGDIDLVRAWEQWTRDATYRERQTDLGRLNEWIEVTAVVGGVVTFEAHNVFLDGDYRVYTTVLNFRDAPTLRTALQAAGFQDIEVHRGVGSAKTSPGRSVLS
jgi:predicted TPR repeat methyltransferase